MKETLRDEREREGMEEKTLEKEGNTRKIDSGERRIEQKIDGRGRESKEQKMEDEWKWKRREMK
jgi:hypothetical protein